MKLICSEIPLAAPSQNATWTISPWLELGPAVLPLRPPPGPGPVIAARVKDVGDAPPGRPPTILPSEKRVFAPLPFKFPDRVCSDNMIVWPRPSPLLMSSNETGFNGFNGFTVGKKTPLAYLLARWAELEGNPAYPLLAT